MSSNKPNQKSGSGLTLPFLLLGAVGIGIFSATRLAPELFESLNLPAVPGIFDRSTKNVAVACQSLKEAFPNDSIRWETDDEFHELNDHFSRTAHLTPSCIFTPKSTEEVSKAVQLLRAANTKFAILGGGHDPNPGHSGIQDGVLIATREMNDLSYNKETEELTIGSGLKWAAVYDYMEQFKRVPLGGRLGMVGVGGYLLGGGLSHFSNKHGLAVSSIVGYEIVLANSTTINVSEDEHPLLFRALKGGSNNFGIVTKFTLKTYPLANDVWGGPMFHNFSDVDQFTDAFIDYATTGRDQEKKGASAVLPYLFPTNGTIVNTYFYEKPEVKPDVMSAFWKVPTLEQGDLTSVQSFAALTRGLSTSPNGIDRWSNVGITIEYTGKDVREAFSIITNMASEASKIQGGTLVVLPQPIFEPASKSGGTDVLGLTEQSQCWLAISMGWMHAKDDKHAHGVTKSILEQIKQKTTRTPAVEFMYLNDAGFDQPVLQSYGKDNIKVLKEAARLYDPEGIFQKLVPGGFKVSKV